MGTSLWKLTALRDNAKLKKGMSAEIFQANSVNKPTQKVICENLNTKYGTNISEGSCGLTNFEIVKLSK